MHCVNRGQRTDITLRLSEENMEGVKAGLPRALVKPPSRHLTLFPRNGVLLGDYINKTLNLDSLQQYYRIEVWNPFRVRTALITRS